MSEQKKRTDGIIKVVSGERFTPYGLALKLKAKVILESSSFKKGRERYSLLMIDEAFRVYQKELKIFLKKGGTEFNIKSPARDILDVLKYFANQHTPLHQDLPFPAGGIGFLTYEFCRFCDTIQLQKKADELSQPDALFLFGHVFIVFDHYTDLLYLIGLNYKEHEIDLQKAIDETERKINDLNFNYLSVGKTEYSAQVVSPDDRDWYMRGVETIREEIKKGNLLQAVLSRRMKIKTEMSALEAYRNLRSSNPSPYLFYIDFGDTQIFGSSPEAHAKVCEGMGTLRPIAGTRRRGKNAAEDKVLEAELLADEKERAEHLMLVDLARNDLGRISRPGTVTVTNFMEVERYSHVMHIVSNVNGTLAYDTGGMDAVRATFPAGTVSGAPKIKAIETLDKIESKKRSFYAGLVGYIGVGGNLDTCITIRSAFKTGDTIVLQAGAGIVYDSVPEREYEETSEKLRALATAIGVEV